MGHRKLGSSGTGHQQNSEPEKRHGEKLSDGHPFAIFHQIFNGAGGEIIDVIQRNQSPQTGKHLPGTDPESSKEKSGQKYHTDASPAVEGMQKTHDRFFVVKGTGFHDRTAQDLDQSASDGIDDHTDQNTDEGIRQDGGQKSKPDESGGGGDLRGYNALPVSDAIHKMSA